MAHVRTQIRAAAKSLLLGSAEAGSRVFDSRTRPLAKGEGPSIFLYAANEVVDIGAQGVQQQRVLTLRIDCIAKDQDGEAQDVLDAICVHVERQIMTSQTFGGLALSTALRSTDFLSSGQGETPFAVASLAFLVTYFTSEDDPETAL